MLFSIASGVENKSNNFLMHKQNNVTYLILQKIVFSLSVKFLEKSKYFNDLLIMLKSCKIPTFLTQGNNMAWGPKTVP